MQKPGADKDIPLLISGLLNDDEVSVKVHFLQQAMLTENDPETKKNLQTRLIVLSESAGSSELLLAAKREQWHREHHEYLPIMLDFLISNDNP